MSIKTLAILTALLIFCCPYLSHASEKDKQVCADTDIEPFSEWLELQNLKLPQPDTDYLQLDAERTIVNGTACKDSKANNNERIVVITYVVKEQEGYDAGEDGFIIGVIDKKTKEILSTYYTVLIEDAGFTMANGGSVQIDTARYNLAKDVRAFGVDVTVAISHIVLMVATELNEYYMWSMATK